MSSPPPEDKIRATRGVKRNFSFESRPTSKTESTCDLNVDRFDIASLVTEIERTIELGPVGELRQDIAEEQLSDQVTSFVH
jgi:hypothetical protein